MPRSSHRISVWWLRAMRAPCSFTKIITLIYKVLDLEIVSRRYLHVSSLFTWHFRPREPPSTNINFQFYFLKIFYIELIRVLHAMLPLFLRLILSLFFLKKILSSLKKRLFKIENNKNLNIDCIFVLVFPRESSFLAGEGVR